METLRYLIIQTAFIGDCILTLPLIQKIIETNNNIIIDVLTTPPAKEIFELSPYVDNIFVYDKRKDHKGIIHLFKYAKKLQKFYYDKIITPHRSFRSSLISFLSKAKETVSFDKSSLSFLYDKRVKYQSNFHEVLRNFSLISYFPDINEIKNLSWNLKLEQNFIQKFYQGDKKKITIAPGSIWFTKRYPIKYFIEIVDFLLKNEYIIFIIGSKSEKQLALEIKNKYPEVIDLVGDLTLKETFYLLKDVDLLIANDSAPTHIGALLDINVITLYCSTVPEFGFFPFNKNGYYLSVDIDCKPCGIHGHKNCPKNHFNCAWELKPYLVIDLIKQILE